MAAKLVFTKDSPLNTTLVDEARGAVMYEIETERSFLSKTTVIRKPTMNQRGKSVPHTSTEVARIQWKTWSSDRIEYHGHEMKREEFMPKAGFLSQSFLITVDGTECRWSTGRHLPKLVTNDRRKTVIAELHKAHHVFHRRKAFLEVAPAGFAMLDLIVVSLVYVETKRREKGSGEGGEDGGDGGDGGGGGGDGGGGGGDGGGGGGGGGDGGGGGGGC